MSVLFSRFEKSDIESCDWQSKRTIRFERTIDLKSQNVRCKVAFVTDDDAVDQQSALHDDEQGLSDVELVLLQWLGDDGAHEDGFQRLHLWTLHDPQDSTLKIVLMTACQLPMMIFHRVGNRRGLA